MFSKIQEYLKFIVAMIGAVGVTTISAIFEGIADPQTIITAVISLLTAASVYAVENKKATEKAAQNIVALHRDPVGIDLQADASGAPYWVETDATPVAEDYEGKHRSE